MFFLFVLCLVAKHEAALVINATPAKLHVGLSRNFLIECTLSRDSNPAMLYLTSMSIYHSRYGDESLFNKSSETQKREFIYLASINSFDAVVDVDKDIESRVKYFGRVNNKNESALRLIWDSPDSKLAGVYKCEANGISSKGKPVSLTSEALVTAIDPDTKALIVEIQKLTGIMESLRGRINTTESRIDSLDTFRRRKLFKQQALENALFVVSPEFQGRRYLLTKNLLLITANQAEVLCGIFGGYLAEIDSEEELQFIKDHLLSRKLFQFVVTGATDELQEGVWINRYSNTPAKVIKFGKGEPNNGREENCQSYGYYIDGWYMNDLSCSIVSNYKVGFLCEVEI